MILRGKKWLDKDETTETFDIDAESLEEALELKKGAKFAKFIDRVVTALDLNKEKIHVESPRRTAGCGAITELAGKVLRCLTIDKADSENDEADKTQLTLRRWQKVNEDWFYSRHSFSHHIFVLSRNDIGEFSHSKAWTSKCLVIVDEAHNWRKPDNKAPRCYSEYWKDLCRYALLLTATPLQLNAAELTSILRLFSDDATAEKLQWEATLGEAIRQQEAILTAWEALDTVDARYLVEKAKDFADRFGAEPSQNQQRCFWKSLESAESQRLAALSRQVLKFDEFLQGGIREKLSRNLVKNRMDKNRSVYCGNDVESESDGADGARKYFYRTRGITNTASLFNFICMRASAEADVSTDETQQRKPRLLRGWTSSFAALEDSAEWKKSAEKGGVYEKAQLNELLSKASHPKVSVTVKTVCDSLFGDADHPGEKVVVFCERLRTVDDIKHKVEEGIRDRIRALALNQGLSEARIKEIYNANLTESDSDANAEDREEQQNQSRQKALWAAAQNLAQRIWPGMPFPDRDDLMVPQEKYDTRPFLAFWYVTDLLKDKGEKKVSLTVEQVEDAYFDLMRSVIPAKDAQEYDDADPVTDAVAALTGDGTDQNERPWLLRGFSSPGFPLALICSQISQEGVDMHTYCRRIVLHDLNWNPAKLEQRIGRVDRRGSYALKNRKKVEVYVPFMADSYEEYQYERVLERSAMQELYFGCNDLLELNEEGKGKGKARAEDSDNKDDTSVPALADIGPLIKGLFDMDFSVKVKNGERKKNAA